MSDIDPVTFHIYYPGCPRDGYFGVRAESFESLIRHLKDLSIDFDDFLSSSFMTVPITFRKFFDDADFLVYLKGGKYDSKASIQ